MLRALASGPGPLDAWLAEVGAARGANQHLDAAVHDVLEGLGDLSGEESRARSIAAEMAVALEAALLYTADAGDVADLFCAARLGPERRGVYGTLPATSDLHAVMARATPQG